MNDSFDLNPKSDRSADSDRKDHRDREARYLEFIELLIDKSIKRLQSKSYRPKIQDALRAIRLKHKVFKDSEAEKSFWDMIEETRQEELPKLYPESKPEPIDIESQIINTIKGLKYQVINGTLPVKIITDYFNYGKSNESRLTYSRLGRILSTMGFRKTKTSNGCSAILWRAPDGACFWDDQLLSKESPQVQETCRSEAEIPLRGASANISKSPGVPESCQKDPAEDSSTLPNDPSLPKGETTTSSNSTVSNVHNSLPDNGLEEK